MGHTRSVAGALSIIALFALTVGHVAAAGDAVQAVNANGRAFDVYQVDEDIYVSGRCLDAADSRTDVYVVGDRGSWKDGTELVDVSGGVEEVDIDEDGELTLTRVWDSRLDVGEYDVVLDTDEDGEYDEGECVTDDGFKVIDAGEGTVKLGSKSPDEDFRWRVKFDEPFVVMLQVRLFAKDLEDLRITTFTIDASGTGNERESLLDVIVAEDRGGDGEYRDGSDTILGHGTYVRDSGEITIATNFLLEAGDSANILIVYAMGADFLDGKTFLVDLDKVEAEGVISEERVRLLGTPISSYELEIYGSGDAQPIERYVNPPLEPDELVDEEIGDSESADGGDSLFSGIFSGSTEEGEVSGEDDGLPPLWLRVTFLSIIGLIILVMIWKALRALINLFL